MTVASSTRVGRYIYAFVRASDAASITSTGMVGLYDASIEAEKFGDLAAIVSPIAETNIRPRRKLLAAHQNIVAEISRNWDMLPFSFGLIVENEEELNSLVISNADRLLSVLDRVSGKIEMSLSMSLATSDPVQYIVSKNEELQQARDQIAAGLASRDQQIEMGRLFESILTGMRSEEAQKFASALSTVCAETQAQDPKTESELVRMNCLIPRDGEQAFEEAIHQLASQYDQDYAFSFNGPWPPYSFVDLKLSLE